MQHGASHSRSMLVLPPLSPLSLSPQISSPPGTSQSLRYVRTCISHRSASCCERACVPCVNGKDTLQGCVSQQ